MRCMPSWPPKTPLAQTTESCPSRRAASTSACNCGLVGGVGAAAAGPAAGPAGVRAALSAERAAGGAGAQAASPTSSARLAASAVHA
jgi:hypothetical protein